MINLLNVSLCHHHQILLVPFLIYFHFGTHLISIIQKSYRSPEIYLTGGLKYYLVSLSYHKFTWIFLKQWRNKFDSNFIFKSMKSSRFDVVRWRQLDGLGNKNQFMKTSGLFRQSCIKQDLLFCSMSLKSWNVASSQGIMGLDKKQSRLKKAVVWIKFNNLPL